MKVQIDCLQWNVMASSKLGSNFSFVAAFYFDQLELLPCLQTRACKGGNKGSISEEGEKNDAKNKKSLPLSSAYHIIFFK